MEREIIIRIIYNKKNCWVVVVHSNSEVRRSLRAGGQSRKKKKGKK